jgi:hypothetical protein
LSPFFPMCTHYQNGNESICVPCLREKNARYHDALKTIILRIREIGDDAPAELIYDIFKIVTAALRGTLQPAPRKP